MPALFDHLGFVPMLGRLPKLSEPPRMLAFEPHISLPDIPISTNWRAKLSTLGMMGNDLCGLCTLATHGHAVQAWTANLGGEVTIPTEIIIQTYSQLSGYNPKTGASDTGLIETNVISFLETTGIGGHKIIASTITNIRRLDYLKAACYLLGGVRLCGNLPISLQNQTLWTDPKGDLSGDNAPGSWGGHSFWLVDYDQDFFYIVSWGKIFKMDPGWWLAYGDEAHPVLSMDWIKSDKSPNGIDLALLQQDLKNLY